MADVKPAAAGSKVTEAELEKALAVIERYGRERKMSVAVTFGRNWG